MLVPAVCVHMCVYGGRGKGRENEERGVCDTEGLGDRQEGEGKRKEDSKKLITKRKIMRKGEESEKMEGG